MLLRSFFIPCTLSRSRRVCKAAFPNNSSYALSELTKGGTHRNTKYHHLSLKGQQSILSIPHSPISIITFPFASNSPICLNLNASCSAFEFDRALPINSLKSTVGRGLHSHGLRMSIVLLSRLMQHASEVWNEAIVLLARGVGLLASAHLRGEVRQTDRELLRFVYLGFTT